MRHTIILVLGTILITLAACGGGGSGGGDDGLPKAAPDLLVTIDGDQESEVYLTGTSMGSHPALADVSNLGDKAPKLPFDLMIKRLDYDAAGNLVNETEQTEAWVEPLEPGAWSTQNIDIPVHYGMIARIIIQAKNTDDNDTSDNTASITVYNITGLSNKG